MTEHRPTVTEVVAKLQTYGSADQLAAFFEEQGVVGERNRTASCPIARYVKREIGAEVVSVSAYYVMAKSDRQYDEEMIGDTILPDFISRFDQGHYPALEATP